MERAELVVIGAGISGLSFAHMASQRGIPTLVLEKSDRAGGCFHSHRFLGPFAEFWLEMGAHTCYNSYGSFIGMLEELHLTSALLPRQKVSFKMLVDGKLCSIPSQLNFFELACSLPRLVGRKKSGSSVVDYYAPIVGRRNYERLFSPAFNAVLSQRADDFPATMLFKSRPRRKDILRSFTLNGGLQTVTDAIVRENGVQLHTGVTITSIRRVEGEYQIESSDGRRFAAKTLVLATPPDATCELLRELSPAVANKLSAIRVESIDTIGVALPREAVQLPPVAGLIAVNDSFFSAVSRDTVLDPTYRGLAFHFRGGNVTRAQGVQRIAELLGVEQSQFLGVASRENRLPSLQIGNDALTSAIDSTLAGSSIGITGNYFLGLAIEDCVSRSQAEFQRLFPER